MIWIDQCEAARDIRDAFGLQKAIGYLIGEKFLKFLQAADQDPAFADELPRFVEEIKGIFDYEEIRAYLESVRLRDPRDIRSINFGMGCVGPGNCSAIYGPAGRGGDRSAGGDRAVGQQF